MDSAVISDELRQQFDSLCENFQGRLDTHARHMARFRFAWWLQQKLAWINIPIWLASLLLLLDGRASLALTGVIAGNAVIIVIAVVYRSIAAKRLRNECDELTCMADVITEYLKQNPGLPNPTFRARQ